MDERKRRGTAVITAVGVGMGKGDPAPPRR